MSDILFNPFHFLSHNALAINIHTLLLAIVEITLNNVSISSRKEEGGGGGGGSLRTVEVKV